MEITRICPRCKRNLSLSSFYKRAKRKTPSGYCKDCRKKRLKLQREENPEYMIKRAQQKRLKRYGITEKDYNILFKAQKGKCAICGTHQNDLNKSLSIDHNHKTREIRGLLCNPCNLGLGSFKDDIIRIEKALKYLKTLK